VVTAADPETGQLLTAGGAVVTVDYQPLAVGPVRAVERGDYVVAVSQRLALPDGSHLEVGVSSPLRPVTDSLDTMRTMLWIAVPALVAAVGVITWFAAQRALQPVHTITQRARAITATNLSERVPVPASSDDVNELATTMNEMLARLDHAQQRQRQFIADASHELRSPVAASCAQLEVALAHPDSVDWAATAATVLTEQAHLGRLIEDLLALSRLDEQGAGTLGDVDLDELVAAEAARHHSIPVRAEVAEPVRIRGNATLIARAVRNLVDNAGRHATTAVTVTVTVRQPDPALAVIHVDDDGPGVAAEQRIRIFDRFTRLDDARRRDDGGTGLGLAIAREVTRAHGGQISCEEAPGGGARFTLWFPTGGPP
jgi:signal transduction histidine kinase